jgi:hypothetical protein
MPATKRGQTRSRAVHAHEERIRHLEDDRAPEREREAKAPAEEWEAPPAVEPPAAHDE